MNEIYKKINAETDGKYKNLRFPKVTFGKTAEVTVVCKKSDREFVDKELSRLTAIISNICAFHTPISISVLDEQPTTSALRAAVVKFTKKFSYVSSMLHTISVQTDPVSTVKISMHNAMYDLAKTDYIPRLEEFLANNYAEEIKTEINIVEYRSNVQSKTLQDARPKEYKLNDIKPLIGDLKPKTALSVSGLTSASYNAIVCGIIAMPTHFTSKSGRSYYKFLLYDGDDTVQCTIGVSGDVSIDRSLINKSVCVLGNVEYDSVRDEATIAVREMSLCTADGLNALQPLPEPDKYEIVHPTAYEEYVQSSMFDSRSTLPQALKGSFVVFDFETTGLSVMYDKPTELGAVKIVDGKITEVFSTFIDPRREIPPDVVAKTGITNEMVIGQPLIEDVLPDFYKFTYGCCVVCHNIAFDFPFLIRCGNGCGWAFGDRPTYDTMAIAPLALPGIQRISLDKVLEGLGLSNENAHRAYADAAATAKAFIAMQKILDKRK